MVSEDTSQCFNSLAFHRMAVAVAFTMLLMTLGRHSRRRASRTILVSDKNDGIFKARREYFEGVNDNVSVIMINLKNLNIFYIFDHLSCISRDLATQDIAH